MINLKKGWKKMTSKSISNKRRKRKNDASKSNKVRREKLRL